jgi:carboxypeptidase C (cathepsin A)
MEDGTTTFVLNEYSWNKEANMLYIESPAGVGFSYCVNMKDCNFDDMSSSVDNLGALQDFYFKFPEYLSHDLYISGESYAGVYVPYLAYQIDKYNDDPSTFY